ncbi:MAG: NAD-dependent epimerase/dehydratase family protein [Nitrospinales bacterium]
MANEFKNKTVLVTGASGFIGSHLTRRLVGRGANVHVFARQGTDLWRLEDLIANDVTVWNTDINDLDRIRQFIKQICPQRVFHLAAAVNPGRSLDLLDEMIAVNIQGTVTLLKALEESDLESFVHVGTCEEYGDGAAPFDEEQREASVSPYSASKISATHFSQMFHKITGKPVIIVRPFLTYGPGQVSNMLIPSLIRHCLNHEPQFHMTKGQQTREFNYVSDVVEGIVRASDCGKRAGEIVNIGNGKEYKVIEVARMIVKIMDSPIKLQCGTLNHRKGEVNHFYASTDKFTKLLKPPRFTSLKEGLEKTIAWFAEHLGKNKAKPVCIP